MSPRFANRPPVRTEQQGKKGDKMDEVFHCGFPNLQAGSCSFIIRCNVMDTKSGTSGRGCFFYGCLTLFILFVVGTTAIFFGTRWMINSTVLKFTTPTAKSLPTVDMSREQYETLESRLQDFAQALESGGESRSLTLTAEEINALIVRSEDWQFLQDRVYITIQDNRIGGEINWPLDEFSHLPFMKQLRGRFVNGAASFQATLESGVLLVTLNSLTVNNKPVPEAVITQLQDENLVAELYKDPAKVKILQKLQSLKITDGTVVITTRPRIPEESPPDTSNQTTPTEAVATP